ncbi:hypothetical protein V474_07960 [Novosphingobium barchaimii LL02]|uniref:Uncharacterized protein n=1 Tax=Novosphingobium barchaimii LL02 TaxID=1114963 RepID=A0A0J7Y8U8_9SPHN|nr:hypothetical protein V474_07960 [Novosphingobium barchaimii LL02]
MTIQERLADWTPARTDSQHGDQFDGSEQGE